ncbi:MAG: TetR/AcrR family transcriptional regulator [Actinomycetota bacterium]
MGRTPSDEVVDRIATAALVLLEGGGVRAMTLRGVCTAAGVSRQTFINRLGSMEGRG